jgi:hypothetical protein
MRTKCPKQLEHLAREKIHQYAPRFKIKPHSKDAWQSPKNPLAHPKCVNHM